MDLNPFDSPKYSRRVASSPKKFKPNPARAKQAINQDDARGYRTQRAKEIRKDSSMEGQTRTKMLMSNPPIKVVERFTNGKWVVVSRERQPKATGAKRRPADIGSAIKRMQRDQPWN